MTSFVLLCSVNRSIFIRSSKLLLSAANNGIINEFNLCRKFSTFNKLEALKYSYIAIYSRNLPLTRSSQIGISHSFDKKFATFSYFHMNSQKDFRNGTNFGRSLSTNSELSSDLTSSTESAEKSYELTTDETLIQDNSDGETDKLFEKVIVEVRGHDKAVLESYVKFLQSTCKELELELASVEKFPYVWWMQTLLKSKYVHKKHKVQYETRTHIRKATLLQLTGSTASTVLEYLQRNLPEGVAMKVTYNELLQLPDHLQHAFAHGQLINEAERRRHEIPATKNV